MKAIELDMNPKVMSVFNSYPSKFRLKLLNLRALILETAQEENVTDLEETLKWNEPSYVCKNGSTIRIAWHAKQPDVYGLYFQCTSKLIPTFKLLYNDKFNFEGSRAILFNLDDELPVQQLKQCIKAALHYHNIKHLPQLGLL